MQPLEHNPGAAVVGTQVAANAARGLAGGTAATTEVTALVPAGAEEVSVQAAMAFATEGLESMALNALAQEEMARAGASYAEASALYNTVDEANSATLT